MAKLYLIRHGETDLNAKGIYCGQGNPSLNDRGRWQAERLYERLKTDSVDRVYSSNLARAKETAQIIFKGSDIIEDARLGEIDFGLFAGLRYEDAMAKYPQVYKMWIDNPLRVQIPQGESLKEFAKRVEKSLSCIISESNGLNIAIVTHGGCIRIILCNALNWGLERFWDISQQTTALNIIEYPKEGLPVVGMINDTSHLS